MLWILGCNVVYHCAGITDILFVFLLFVCAILSTYAEIMLCIGAVPLHDNCPSSGALFSSYSAWKIHSNLSLLRQLLLLSCSLFFCSNEYGSQGLKTRAHIRIDIGAQLIN